jgi:hypothetical protein
MDRDAEARREARGTWPIERHRLGDEPPELLAGATPSELVAMVHRLTLDAWATARMPIPEYPRSQAPGRVVRPRS